MKKRIQQLIISPGVQIALVSIATVGLLRSTDSVPITPELSNKAQDFITLTLSIFIEAFPFLVLGSLLASVVLVYIPPTFIHRILPKRGVLRRGALSLMGFLFPVCECGNVPLSRALLMQGMKPSDAVTFLLAAPVLNPVTIWATWAAFGYDSAIVIARVVATFFIANLIGYFISLRKNEQDFLKKDFIALCKDTNHSNKQGLGRKKFTQNFVREASIMLKMLVVGAVVAGVIQSFVPRDLLTSIGSNVVLSILAMLLLAFVVSICANVDSFFALSFANTFTAGSIVSFLVFGPMVDIKIITLLKTTFKNNLIITMSGLSLLLSALAGLVVSYAF